MTSLSKIVTSNPKYVLFSFKTPRIATWLLWLSRISGPLAIVCLFAPAMLSRSSGQNVLAFRDVSFFYTPLYQYVGERCHGDWLPLWNDRDHSGLPLLGETTTAVLYPIRYALYSLPLSAEVAIAWYVVIHLVLTSVFAQVSAHWLGVSRGSAPLLGVLYPLSGVVSFLYCNPPFLVSATWLPLALGVGLANRQARSIGGRLIFRGAILGLALTMMVLGGDPQTALHTVMVIGCYSLFGWLSRRRRVVPLNSRADSSGTFRVLCIAGTLALLMSMPQVAASIAWSRQSARVDTENSTSIVAPPAKASRQHEAFQYSLQPWQLAEWISPASNGDFFPIYRRLDLRFEMPGRIWSESVYGGVFAVLALSGFLVSRRCNRWFAVAGVSVALAFGSYGAGWLWTASTGREATLDSATLGPYWWLYHFFPGYDLFRYPAKWLPLATFATSVLAGQFLDQTRCVNWRPSRALFMTFAVATLFSVGTTIYGAWKSHAFPVPLTDRFWGPLDVAGAIQVVVGSWFHTLVVTLLMLVILIRWPKRQWKAAYPCVLVVLSAIEMTVAASHWISQVPKSDVDRLQSVVTTNSVEARDRADATRYLRTTTEGGWPVSWRQRASDVRMTEVEASMRRAWFGRWHLASDEAVWNSMVTLPSRSDSAIWHVMGESRKLSRTVQQQRWEGLRHMLSLNGTTATTGESVESTLDSKSFHVVDANKVSQDDIRSPVTLHSEWTSKRYAPDRRDDVRERIKAYAADMSETVPMLYADSLETIPTAAPAATPRAPNGNGSVEAVVASPDFEIFRVTTTQSQLLRRSMFQDGHWTATLVPVGGSSSRIAPVHVVDLLSQGVIVPPGDWLVEFRYRPSWLHTAIWFGVVGWGLWTLVIVRSLQAARYSQGVPVQDQ